MTPLPEANRTLSEVLSHAELEHGRAARAAEIAVRHERQQLIGSAETLREFHARMAAIYRRVEQRHLVTADIHTMYAKRLRVWIERDDQRESLPLIMASIAEAASAAGAGVTLFDGDKTETLTAASDACAKAAQDLEFTFGEGPAHDVVDTNGPVRVSGSMLRARWPTYGPALGLLGIRSLVAVPIKLTRSHLGALTLFGPHPRPESRQLDSFRAIADTLAVILLEPDVPGLVDNQARRSLLAQADQRAIVHQATGIVSVQCGCTVADALAMIRARAYAENRHVGSLATDIVEHGARLS